MELNFIKFLEAELAARPPARKGARTREQLRIAAARILSEQGYHSLRLRDITQAAGAAEGTIYAHFNDRNGVINAVMDIFLDNFLLRHLEEHAGLDERGSGASAFDAIRHSTRHWFALCNENKGMMRCVYQMSDDEPAFAAHIQDFNFRWTQKVTLARLRDHGGEVGPPLLLTYAVKYMTNELVRRLIIYPDPKFVSALDQMGGDQDLVADVVTLVWLKMLYPDEPLPRNEAGLLADTIGWITPGAPNAPVAASAAPKRVQSVRATPATPERRKPRAKRAAS